MGHRTVVLIGTDRDFSAQLGFFLSCQGWDTARADLGNFRLDAVDIPREAVLVIALGSRPDTAIAAIRDVRNRLGYGPGVIAITDGTCVTEVLDAGADIFLNAVGAEKVLPAAIAAVSDMASRWQRPPDQHS